MKKDVNVSLVQGGKLTKGGWLTIVSFLLVAVLALSVALGLVVKSHKEEKLAEEVSASGGMVLSEAQEENGISLVSMEIPRSEYAAYDIMQIDESAYKITATIKMDGKGEVPDFMKGVTWEMAWKSSTSVAVTDYVTMTESEDSAIFACKKAFSTQIVVTVKSKYDDSKSAMATLDYRKKITGVNVKVGTETSVVTSSNHPVLSATFPVRYESSSSMPSSGDWVSTSFFNWFGIYEYSEGTVNPSSGSSGSIKIKPSAEFQAKYNEFRSSSLIVDMATEVTMNKNADISMVKTVLQLYQKLTKQDSMA